MIKAIQKLIIASAGDGIKGLDCPASFVVSISQSAIHKLLAIGGAGFDYSDMVHISLGNCKFIDDEGEEMKDLDWRPTVARIMVNGQFSRGNLCRDIRVSVGNRDVDGEFLWGYLQITEEELAHLMDDGEEEGEFNVYAVTTITRAGQTVHGTRNQILERCNDPSGLQSDLIYAKEESSETSFVIDHIPAKEAI